MPKLAANGEAVALFLEEGRVAGLVRSDIEASDIEASDIEASDIDATEFERDFEGGFAEGSEGGEVTEASDEPPSSTRRRRRRRRASEHGESRETPEGMRTWSWE